MWFWQQTSRFLNGSHIERAKIGPTVINVNGDTHISKNDVVETSRVIHRTEFGDKISGEVQWRSKVVGPLQ